MVTPNEGSRGLTVEQLIEVLRTMPPGARVVFRDAEWGLIEIGGARALTAAQAEDADYSYKHPCVWLTDAEAGT